MKLILKPSALTPGATLGVVAPAGPARDYNRVAAGLKTLDSLGFRLVLGTNALKRTGYLAGSDEERLADLCGMFQDRDIDGILCLRGGYGSMRLLGKIDYRLIRRNPKILVGYSDITALQLAIWKRAGLVTFSGPMLATEFGKEPDDLTLGHFLKAVSDPYPLGIIPAGPGHRAVTINPGQARGRLLGGNLSLVAATLGTPYELDTRGAILFLEEVGEQPYRIDRLLSQLRLAGKLTAAAGVIFGECVGCEAEDSFSLLELIEQFFSDLKIPCYYGLCAGHGPLKATLPLGVSAEMDAGRCQLKVIEPATRPR